MTRLGLFVFYDKDGIVDDYVPYLLRDMMENLTRLVIIVNGVLTDEGRSRLSEFTDGIVLRENKGFDAAAWQFAMRDYLGWDEVGKYDELVMFNDTFFGPLYPFKEVFAKMGGKEVDFWGLLKHGAMDKDIFGNNPYKCCPAHLQTYFLVVRRSMHVSNDFKIYWDRLPVYKTFESVAGKHEIAFTKVFEEKGYTWSVYMDTDQYDQGVAILHYGYNVERILKDGCPIIKRKPFSFPLGEILEYNNAEDYKLAMDYIQYHTDYDTKMIFQNLLRCYNVSEIHDALHMEYIIDNESLRAPMKKNKETCVVLHIHCDEAVDRYKPYIKSVPEDIDVIITTTYEEKRKRMEETLLPLRKQGLHVVLVENLGGNVAAMLIGASTYLKKYKYFCFCHDNALEQEVYPCEYYADRVIWENTLSNETYIRNVLNKMDEEPCLGIIAPPSAFCGSQASLTDTRLWGSSYSNMQKILTQIGVKVPIEETRPPLTVETAFWCRTDALKPLLEYPWKYEDFEAGTTSVEGTVMQAIERSYAFVAQAQGYYTAIGMTPEYASVFVNNYKYWAMNHYGYVSPQIGIKRIYKVLSRIFSEGKGAFKVFLKSVFIYVQKKMKLR